MQVHANMLTMKLSPSPLRVGEQSLDNLLEAAAQMPLLLCWHVAPEEYGDTGMGSGAMGGAGAGEVRNESAAGSGTGDEAGTQDEDTTDLIAGSLDGSVIIPTDPEGTIIVDTDDDGIADVVVTDVDDDGNLDVIVFAGTDAGTGNDHSDTGSTPNGAAGGDTSLNAALAGNATGQDPMQGGVDFESGGNMGGPDDTGGIDVNALNTGEEGNPASS